MQACRHDCRAPSLMAGAEAFAQAPADRAAASS